MASPLNPMQHLLEQIQNLLKMYYENKDKPAKELPKDITERLQQVEREVELFQKFNEKVFDEMGISEEQLKKMTAELEPRERRILDSTEKLKKEVEQIQQDLSMQAMTAKQRKKKQGTQQRKKKFNQLGGRKDWKYL